MSNTYKEAAEVFRQTAARGRFAVMAVQKPEPRVAMQIALLPPGFMDLPVLTITVRQ